MIFPGGFIFKINNVIVKKLIAYSAIAILMLSSYLLPGITPIASAATPQLPASAQTTNTPCVGGVGSAGISVKDANGTQITVTTSNIHNSYLGTASQTLARQTDNNFYNNGVPNQLAINGDGKNSILYKYDTGSNNYTPVCTWGKVLVAGTTIGNGLSQTVSTSGSSGPTDPCIGSFFNLIASLTNPVGLAMCEATFATSNALQGFIGYLIGPALETVLNMPANILSDPVGSSTLQQAWTVMLRTTLGLLTLVLLIIAFANILNLDEKLGYGINRMIPKIIIAILMAVFSYLLCRALLDLASAFQRGLFTLAGQNSITVASKICDPSNAGCSSNNPISDAIQAASQNQTSGLALIFLIIIFLLLVLAGLWLFIVLMVRVAVIWFLVAAAPLAMLLNIMPFTESYYQKWWKEWWSWLFMGPAVAVMLYFTSLLISGFKASFASTGGASYEPWMLLLMAAVAIFMAGTVPLNMGKTIYGQIQSAGKKSWGWAKTGDKYLNKGRVTNYFAGRRGTIEGRNKMLAEKTRLKHGISGRSFMSGIENTPEARRAAEDKYIALISQEKGMANALDTELQATLLSSDTHEARAAARELASRKGLGRNVNAANAVIVANLISSDGALAAKVGADNRDVYAKMANEGAGASMIGTKSVSELALSTTQATAPKDWKGHQFKFIENNPNAHNIAANVFANKQQRESFFNNADVGTVASMGQLLQDPGVRATVSAQIRGIRDVNERRSAATSMRDAHQAFLDYQTRNTPAGAPVPTNPY